MKGTLLSQIRWYLMIGLIVVGPFHAFLITWLRSFSFISDNFVSVLSVWREFFAAVIFMCVVVELFVNKKRPRFDALDWSIIGFSFLSGIWLIFQTESLTQWLLGFRFDVMPFIFLMGVRHADWERPERLVKIALATASIVMLFGLLQALVLPRDFLTHFGYGTNQGPYVAGTPLTACQFLEHTDAVCRAAGTFAGPLRYGTYLLLVLAVASTLLKHAQKRAVGAGLVGLTLLNIVLTYARSVWIGVFAMGAAMLAFLWKKNKKIVMWGLGGAVLLLIATGVYISLNKEADTPNLLHTIIIRTTSTGEHLKYFRESVEIIKDNPLGIGMGMAGPASFLNKPILPENWYLQIGIEMGIIGLVLFIGILLLMALYLLREKKLALLSALIGISVAGLFTHSFQETTTMLILMTFVGMALPTKSHASSISQ